MAMQVAVWQGPLGAQVEKRDPPLPLSLPGDTQIHTCSIISIIYI